jgi:hypothetical protein
VVDAQQIHRGVSYQWDPLAQVVAEGILQLGSATPIVVVPLDIVEWNTGVHGSVDFSTNVLPVGARILMVENIADVHHCVDTGLSTSGKTPTKYFSGIDTPCPGGLV